MGKLLLCNREKLIAGKRKNCWESDSISIDCQSELFLASLVVLFEKCEKKHPKPICDLLLACLAVIEKTK